MSEIIITNEATIEAEGNFNSKHCTPVTVFSVKDGTIKNFSSILDAAADFGTHHSYISHCLNRKKIYKGCKIIRTKELPMYIGEIAAITNKSAEDARKWQEQEAEKERIRLAEEKRQNDIKKLRTKISKLETEITKCSNAYRTLVDEYNTAKEELAMLENGDDECGCED